MSEVAGRVFDLLDVVVNSDGRLGLVELAGRAGLDKSTASRMLRFLTDRQLVARSPETQRYDVGPAMFRLAAAALRRSQLLTTAQPYLVALRDASGETVSLHLRIGLERICIFGVDSAMEIRSAITPGERRPLFLGASGKVMLAYLESAEAQKVMRSAKAAGVDVAALGDELARVREQRGLCAISARIPGLAALSVPVFGPNGIVGAITAAGPMERWNMERMRKFLPEARQAAQRISTAIGGTFP